MFNTSIISKSAALIFAISSLSFQTTVLAGNNATVVQSGRVDTSTINQDGWTNNATNVQFGYDNYSEVNQRGWHNNAEIGQEGTYNGARVNQRDRSCTPYCY
ncbi:MAG: hypothetical protein ABFS56_12000 [Pseudomonadota bacterium]